MVNTHLQYLKKLKHSDQNPVGNNVLKFGNRVQDIFRFSSVHDHKIDRCKLTKICKDINVSEIEKVISVFSWGGMRYDHARQIFKKWNVLQPIIIKIKNSVYCNRSEIFQEFQNIRKTKSLPFLGIAFYTKLICFINPNYNGYILDQWTAKSINLLLRKPIIDITKNGWVTDKNSSEDYEKYCLLIEKLSKELELNPIKTEEVLFSFGGRNPGYWREYVKKNYTSK